MESSARSQEGFPIFDDFDLDLLIKVLANTAFSILFHLAVKFSAFLTARIRSILCVLYSDILHFPRTQALRSGHHLYFHLLCAPLGVLCVELFSMSSPRRLINASGFIKWYSRLYRNQGSLFFRPAPLEWSEQTVVITGGASGIGELLANTLAVRSVTVVVLDLNPIVTENCEFTFSQFQSKAHSPNL